MKIPGLGAEFSLYGTTGYYRAERGKRAEQYFEAGIELQQKDRFPEAIEQFRKVLVLEPAVVFRG